MAKNGKIKGTKEFFTKMKNTITIILEEGYGNVKRWKTEI